MKVLFVSTIPPSNKNAPWMYVSGIVSSMERTFEEKNLELLFCFLINDNFDKNDLDSKVIGRSIINYNHKNFRFSEVAFWNKSPYHNVFYNEKFANELVDIVKKNSPDFIIFSNLPSAVYIEDIKRSLLKKTKFVLIEHNVEYIIESEFGIFGRSLVQRLYHKMIKKSVRLFEKKVLESVDYVICISKTDKHMLKNLYEINERKIFVVPFTFDFPTNLYRKNKLSDKGPVISFIGTMDWYPNVQGVYFFLSKVFPKIVEKFSNIKFYIVGRNPVKKILKFQKKFPKNVIVTGSVKDVKDYYKLSDIIVIPIFLGSGTKVKVLEAIASGVPTVMSGFVAKDYDFDKEELIIANTAVQFVDSINLLLSDEFFANRVSQKQMEVYNKYLISKKMENVELLKRIFII